MLTLDQVKAVLKENGYIQNIGQIDAKTARALDKDVRKGILRKERIPWLGYMRPIKTTWIVD